MGLEWSAYREGFQLNSLVSSDLCMLFVQGNQWRMNKGVFETAPIINYQCLNCLPVTDDDHL